VNKEEITVMTIRIPKPLYRDLRQLAFDKEVSINSLLLMGANWINQKNFESQLPEVGETILYCEEKPAPRLDTKSLKRRRVADTYLEALYKENPHFKGITIKKRNFLNAMFGKKPISFPQLAYLIDICSDYVGFAVDIEDLRDGEGQ
jgi:hypothetical protein